MATVCMPNSGSQPAVGRGPSQRIDSGADAAAVTDVALVAEMKHEINLLVQEIAELAGQDIEPEKFYSWFLTRVVSAMAAVGGAVWTPVEGGKLKLQYQVNLAQAGLENL